MWALCIVSTWSCNGLFPSGGHGITLQDPGAGASQATALDDQAEAADRRRNARARSFGGKGGTIAWRERQQVFYWRKQHVAGRLGNSSTTLKLLPVTVEPSPSAAPVVPAERPSPGAIHIKLGQAQIRIEGNADPILVRMVLDALRA